MAKAVGTAVSRRTKWHCHCMMADGREVFIAVKAANAAYASAKVHAGYAVEYVLDILTHEQMERKKAYLKPSMLGAVINY